MSIPNRFTWLTNVQLMRNNKHCRLVCYWKCCSTFLIFCARAARARSHTYTNIFTHVPIQLISSVYKAGPTEKWIKSRITKKQIRERCVCVRERECEIERKKERVGQKIEFELEKRCREGKLNVGRFDFQLNS